MQLAKEFDGDDAGAINCVLEKLKARRQICRDASMWVERLAQTFKTFVTSLGELVPKLADLRMGFQADLEQVLDKEARSWQRFMSIESRSTASQRVGVS